MKTALFIPFFIAIGAGNACLAQTDRALARQEVVSAPLRSASAPNVPAHPSPYNFSRFEYPRIEADSRVTFHFKVPDAKNVKVSIAGVPFDMIKGADGVWTYTSAPQSPGYHNYWMVVDGAIVIDPGTSTFIGYGHMCNGFEIPEPGVDFYDLKEVPHGNVLIKNYFSKTANSWRHIFVYTPPGYDADTASRYPVLYLQHGGGEDERVWIEMGRVNLILDNLIAAGSAKPMIVVMETSNVPGAVLERGPGRDAWHPEYPRGGGPYGQLMIIDLIPWVDSHFRTLTDKDHRAMAGLSMGGYMTEAVTMANLDKFSYVGLFSGGTAVGFGAGGAGIPIPAAAPPPQPEFLDLKTIYSGAMTNPADFNKKVKVFFFSYGTEPPLENSQALRKHQDQLIVAGITNSYLYISPGTSHEWQTWRRSLYAFAPLLFR
jgi:enterochelin esterase-like enzyme